MQQLTNFTEILNMFYKIKAFLLHKTKMILNFTTMLILTRKKIRYVVSTYEAKYY